MAHFHLQNENLLFEYGDVGGTTMYVRVGPFRAAGVTLAMLCEVITAHELS